MRYFIQTRVLSWAILSRAANYAALDWEKRSASYRQNQRRVVALAVFTHQLPPVAQQGMPSTPADGLIGYDTGSFCYSALAIFVWVPSAGQGAPAACHFFTLAANSSCGMGIAVLPSPGFQPHATSLSSVRCLTS